MTATALNVQSVLTMETKLHDRGRRCPPFSTVELIYTFTLRHLRDRGVSTGIHPGVFRGTADGAEEFGMKAVMMMAQKRAD